MNREYLCGVLPEHASELVDAGWRVVGASRFSGGMGVALLLVRDVPLGDDRPAGEEIGGVE